MQDIETQKTETPSDRLMSRLREHYPNRQFGAQNGENGSFGAEDVQGVLDWLDELDGEVKEWNENSNRLMALFKSDPVSAQFLNDWAKTGNVAAALVGIFGSDAVREAMGSEEGRELLAKQNQEYLERVSKDAQSSKEMEENYAASLEALDKFGDENGLGDEERSAIFMRLADISDRAIMGRYDVADFRMVLNDMNHDNDVASAREEGVVQGKNEKMDEQRRRSRKPADMPPSLNGQPNGLNRVGTPKKKSEAAAWGLE